MAPGPKTQKFVENHPFHLFQNFLSQSSSSNNFFKVTGVAVLSGNGCDRDSGTYNDFDDNVMLMTPTTVTNIDTDYQKKFLLFYFVQ